MFEQFKENIRLTGETYAEAKQGFKSVVEAYKNAPRIKKALWLSIFGIIVINAIIGKFSVPWYYHAVLLFGLVVLPLWIWVWKVPRR